jgi:hypothetical protein
LNIENNKQGFFGPSDIISDSGILRQIPAALNAISFCQQR